MILCGLTLTDSMIAEIYCGHLWLAWNRIPRRVAKVLRMRDLIWEMPPSRRRRDSKRTLEVVDINESRFCCRVHERHVDDVAKEKVA